MMLCVTVDGLRFLLEGLQGFGAPMEFLPHGHFRTHTLDHASECLRRNGQVVVH